MKLVPVITETDVAMVAGAVTAGTRANYGSASMLWDRYGIEAGYNLDDPFLGTLNDSDRSLTIARFLKWMVETQLVKTSVACRLLTGLRFHFVTHYQDVGVFSSDPVRMAKTTAKRLEPTVLWVDRPNGQPPMPFVMELLDDLRASHWESLTSATVDTKMVYIAVAFASNFGRRPGEVAWMGKSKADHRFCWEDVIFELKYPESGHASDSAMNMYKRTIHGANSHGAADPELLTSNGIRGTCVFADPPCLSAHDLKRTINHAIVVKQARVRRDSIVLTAKGGSLKRVGRLLVNAINPGMHR